MHGDCCQRVLGRLGAGSELVFWLPWARSSLIFWLGPWGVQWGWREGEGSDPKLCWDPNLILILSYGLILQDIGWASAGEHSPGKKKQRGSNSAHVASCFVLPLLSVARTQMSRTSETSQFRDPKRPPWLSEKGSHAGEPLRNPLRAQAREQQPRGSEDGDGSSPRSRPELQRQLPGRRAGGQKPWRWGPYVSQAP